jgi:hypothetical protein
MFVTPITVIMSLIIPDLVEPKSKQEGPKEHKQDETKDKSAQKTDPTRKQSERPKVDGRSSAPGMEGMGDEAIRKFEEAMELEYQKREGGA